MSRALFLAAWLVPATLAAQAGSLKAVIAPVPVPASLAKPIASALSPSAIRVTAGSTVLDFWWVSALPMNAAGPSWAHVAEGTLVGAVNVGSEFRDIRGRVIKPGVYTLRYGIQPQNGDHLGVSPFREFLLLSPAAADTDAAPRGHEGTIEMSKEAIGGSHPAVWSIDPPATKAELLSPHKTELEHEAVIVEVPATHEGKPAGSLRFGIVLIGKIEA